MERGTVGQRSINEVHIFPKNRPPGSLLARYLLITLCGGMSIALAIFLLGLFPGFLLPFTYMLPAILAVCVILAIKLAQAGPADVPPLAAGLGMAFLVGGAVFDMAATVIHSPDLSREMNPVARSLLDSDHGLPFVFTYAVIAQGLYALLLCTLWVALLKHRLAIAGLLRGVRPPLLFFKAVTGGAALSWRQWIFPLRISELPDAYHVMWVSAAVMLAAVVDRWYLGLEWFGLVSGLRLPVVVVGTSVGLAIYVSWLWFASRETAPAGPVAPAGLSQPQEPDASVS
jgi:hypothetical protein